MLTFNAIGIFYMYNCFFFKGVEIGKHSSEKGGIDQTMERSLAVLTEVQAGSVMLTVPDIPGIGSRLAVGAPWVELLLMLGFVDNIS